jgi:hypothetical protein
MKKRFLLFCIVYFITMICYGQFIPTVGITNTFNMTSGQSTTFHDPNGPGGAPCTTGTTASGSYDNCGCFTTTTICAAPGEFFTITFTEFSMWNTTSGWDWMVIYDGPNTASPVIYDNSAGGPDNPEGDCGLGGGTKYFCSTGQCMTFRFWATSVVNRAGWDANVSSVPTQCGILPIELETFIGTHKDGVNVINWVTATETNNSHFLLYRSRGGEHWEEIARIEGGGTTNTPSFYEFIDNTYLDGTNYYRLAQVDFDSNSEVFNVISITTKTTKSTPNVKAYNLAGQEVPLDYRGYKILIYK